MNRTKADIIYERIKSAYGGLSNDELGEQLSGVSGQAIYKRKKENRYDIDEIITAFPDINREWLRSNDINDLMKLDVQKSRDQKVHQTVSVDQPQGELSQQTKRDILEQIEAAVQILKQNL